MSGILVVAEHRQGMVRDVTFEVISAATQLQEAGNGTVAVAVLGNDLPSLIRAVSVEGVDEVVGVSVPDQEFSAATYRAALTALIDARDPAIILLGFTVDGMSYGPAIAARLGAGFASDVIACSGAGPDLIVVREYYAGKVHAELDFPGSRRVVLMLRPTVWAAAGGASAATLTTFEPPAGGAQLAGGHRGFIQPPSSGVDITAADFILAIGRGIGDRENIAGLEALAEKLGATLACSRPLVDSGWLSSDRQVGQSGRTVKPKVYLAMGISGAVQHLAGMKASGAIIAVNSDPEAAIFNVAHYGAVADLMEVAEELDGLL